MLFHETASERRRLLTQVASIACYFARRGMHVAPVVIFIMRY